MSYNRQVPFTHPFDRRPFPSFAPPPWARSPPGATPYPGMNDPWSMSLASRPMPRIFQQNFGEPIAEGEFFSEPFGAQGALVPHRGFYVQRPVLQRRNSGTSEIQTTDQEFKLSLDVNHFEPSELDVSIVNDEVVIHGKHEQRSDDHGSISREFNRRYKLPPEVNPESIMSSLSQDGVLTVSAPRKALEGSAKEHKVPISVQPGATAIGADSAAANQSK